MDICEELFGKSFDDIAEMNYRMGRNGDCTLIKVRLKNSEQKISKSGGYRLIIYCNKKTEEIALLTIYPKKGKYGQANISPERVKFLLSELTDERNHGLLQVHQIEERLTELV